jgi:hypothetical protein
LFWASLKKAKANLMPTEGIIVTRLITEWILDMEEGCQRRDLELKEKTGLSLLELAAKAAGR